jgi:two-component system chemotaxis sensor kinase CheA
LPRTEALAHATEGALLRWRDGRGPPETIALIKTAFDQIREVLADLAREGAEPAGEDAHLIGALGAGPNALDWAIELANIRDRLLARAGLAIGGPSQRLNASLACLDPPALAPIEAAWKTLPLLVEDLSAAVGKPLALSMHGGDTEIASAALAPLRDALCHLIRNCADHGIEPPHQRTASGKPEAGAIHLAAVRESSAIVIALSDDGRGLDTALIRHRAISSGLVFASHAARMSAEQIHAFVFAPGFSTAGAVTTLSGRGVGLDAARALIEALGGRVALHSESGQGTRFTLTIPAAPAAAAPAPDEAQTAAPAIAQVA